MYRLPLLLAVLALSCVVLPQQAEAQTASISNASAREGETIVFTLELAFPATQDLFFTYTTTGVTASDSDYVPRTGANSGEVTIREGERRADLSVETSPDVEREAHETFTITARAEADDPETRITRRWDVSATGTILNVGFQLVTNLVGANQGTAEGDNIVFGAILDTPMSHDVRVSYTTHGISASDDDYVPVTSSVMIPQGNTEAEFTVQTLKDVVLEDDESIEVTATAALLVGQFPLLFEGSTSARIRDVEPAISVSAASALEGSDLVFTVSFDPPANLARVVGYETSTRGHAASANDFVPQVGRGLTVAAGAASATFAVPTHTDNEIETNETFRVTVSMIVSDTRTGRGSSATFTATNIGTIVDQSPATVLVRDATALEGETLAFEVQLSEAVNAPTTVDWYVEGNTATLNTDLADDVPTFGTARIEANATTARIELLTRLDELIEPDETLGALITNASLVPTGTQLHISDAYAMGTITDATVGVSLTPASHSAREHLSFTYTVNLSAPVAEDVNLTWTATTSGIPDGKAASIAVDLEQSTDTFTIPARSTRATFTIRPTEDNLVEVDEEFDVELSAVGDLPDGVAIDPNARRSRATIRDNDQIVLQATPSPGLNFTGEHLANFITVGFRLARGNTGNEPLIVNIVPRADNTLTEGDDYRLFSKQIIVPAHTSRFRGSVGVQIIDDSVTENFLETFRFDLDVASSHHVEIVNTAFFEIEDNDFVRIRLSEPASAVEGDTIVFTAELDYYRTRSFLERRDGGGISVFEGPGSVAKPFKLLWTATSTGFGNSATVADDLAMQSGSVTVPALSQTATISIPIVNDAHFEPDETFALTLTGTDGLDPQDRSGIRASRVTVYPDQRATGTIPSNDESLVAYFPPYPSPSTAIAEGDQGLASDQWSVLREPLLSPRAGAFTWSTVGGTAAAGQDFVAVSNRPADLAFEMPLVRGEFQVRGDTIVEADETFAMKFTPAADDFLFMLLPDGTRRDNLSVTITDDDNAVVSLQPTAAAAEGDGNITFTVELDNPVAEQFSLAWTAADGTATVAEDLGTQSGTVTVPALAQTATFTIAVTDDQIIEPTETFTVRLSGAAADLVDIDPGKITINQSARDATGTITDNDGATVSISPSRVTVPEGGTLTFRVTLGEPVPEDVTVAWAAAGSGSNAATLADPGSDLADGQASSGTVTFLANTTTAQTITIATVNDTRMEGDETFTVTLAEDTQGGNPLPDGVEFASSSATATITDDDDPIVSITPAQATAEEGNPFTLTVNLSRALSSPVSVIWTAAATGANAATLSGPDSDLGSGQDTTGTVTFLANTTEQTIAITTRDDAQLEADETFTVTLTPSPGGLSDGVMLGTATTATITDNDAATVSIGNASAAENAGPARFTVSLSQVASRDVVLGVVYAAGSADLAADLDDDRPTTVTINANTTSATLAVPLNNDMIVEGTETFTVTIVEDPDTPLLDGVSIPGGTATGTGTITEDDTATAVITQATTASAEGATFTFMAGLSRQVDEAVTVRWTAAPGMARTDPDVNPATVTGPNSDLADGQTTTGTVTFAANDTAPQPFTITSRNDGRDEGDEVFAVTLSADNNNPLPDGVSVPGGATDAIITDRESGSATVSIFPPAATQPEGNSFAFEVRLSQAAVEPVTVTWTATGTGGNAATLTGPGSDLATGQNTTDTVTFIAGDTATKTVSLATVDDDRVEGSETFTVTLTGTLPDGVEFATSSATGTITEDDTAVLSITQEVEAAEGSTVEFDINLSAASMAPVTVRWTATATGDGAATLEGDGSDLATGQVLTGTVLFAADDTAAKTVSLATVDDNRVEGPETFTVTLSQDTQGGNLLPTGVSISTTEGAGTGTITEDDAATVSIMEAAEAAEGSTVEFEVNLSAASAAPVTVRWTATTAGDDGAATLEGDSSDLATGQVITGTVEFAADDTAAKTVSLETVDDDRVEGSETFTVTLSPTTTTRCRRA